MADICAKWEWLFEAFPNRVLNIHPALLPSFRGAHAIQDAYDYGVKVTGVTVHLANFDYDRGPIIAQEPVFVQEDGALISWKRPYIKLNTVSIRG